MRALAAIALFAAGNCLAQKTAPPRVSNPAELEALVAEVENHQHQLDQVRESFTWHEIQDTDYLDSKGAVTGRLSEEREIFYVNRHRIARMVKRDGRDLNPHEAAGEAARVRALAEKAEKHPLEGDHYREGGDLELTNIIAVMRLSNPRRVTLNGRPTMAFDFTGDRKAKAHGIALNAAKKVGGTIWIDEADRQVARVEASFQENFRVGAGLLAVLEKGSFLRLEQTHVSQGLWLPSSSEAHLTGRELLLKGLRVNVRFRTFDFKRFDVATSESVAPPS